MENFRPEAPSLCYKNGNTIYSCPLESLAVSCDFHVSTAFVQFTGRFKNTSKKKIDALFVAHINGTVTNANMVIGKDRLIETAVIANDEMGDVGKKGKNDFGDFVPDYFRLPVSAIPAGTIVEVNVNFLQPLTFEGDSYHFDMDLGYDEKTLPKKIDNKNFKIFGKVNAIGKSVKLSSSTHKLKIDRAQSALDFTAEFDEKCERFALSYSLGSPEIFGTFLREKKYDEKEKEIDNDEFLLFVTPPTSDHIKGNFPRNIVFILDRSGSMNGKPFSEATRALEAGLMNLRKGDRFTIIAFDDKQAFFSDQLIKITKDNHQDQLKSAIDWVKKHPPRGLTDIKTPLMWALDHLNIREDKSLPIVLLITDGCVEEERELVEMAEKRAKKARILTFGIGTYCNWYFLQMLSEKGRGFTRCVHFSEQIYSSAVSLLESVSTPILTDVELEFDDVKDVELFPFPIPDLFVGAPLTIAGRIEGNFPDSVIVTGLLWNGKRFSAEIKLTNTDLIPVSKVFLKQKIDLLTSRQWLSESKELEKEIVKLSVKESMPSKYTSLIAYETTKSKKDKMKKKKMGTGKKIAALAVGGAIVLGAVALALDGDLAATVAGAAPALIGGIGDLIGCCGDCGCIGDLFGSCGDCGCIAGIFSGCGDCCGGLLNCLGGCSCGDCLGEIGGCLGEIGGCCEGIGGCICSLFCN